tara:strand:+ start:26 stop:277 length:252 start_codon:yes stop_codon:yes gene_type:complete
MYKTAYIGKLDEDPTILLTWKTDNDEYDTILVILGEPFFFKTSLEIIEDFVVSFRFERLEDEIEKEFLDVPPDVYLDVQTGAW